MIPALPPHTVDDRLGKDVNVQANTAGIKLDPLQ